jgi:hypothetical protein
LIRANDQDAFLTFCVLEKHLDSCPTQQVIRTTVLVDQIQNGRPPSKGVPDAFVSVRGDQLDYLLDLYTRSIVYLWLENCEPCDNVRAEFDEIFEEPPDDIALFAVYGPNWEDVLAEKFDASMGPMTLFVIDGEVDARLTGDYHRPVFESEIEKLRELS